MARKVPLFYGFSGINNVVKSTRIGKSERAYPGLEEASNVFVTAGGVLDTVPDKVIKLVGDFHSLWGIDDKFYYVKDEASASTIYQGYVDNDLIISRTVALGLTKGLEVSFCSFGDYVYYSNGVDNGRIDGVTRFDWPVQSNSRLENLVDFMPGKHIDSLASRIISLNGDEILFTEAFLPGMFDGAKNRRRLNSSGIMLRSVGVGAYVSDENNVYFLRGINPNEWKLEKVLEYPAIEHGWYSQLVDPGFFGFQSRQPALLFNTVNGLCVGMPTGEVYNLTDKRYRPYFDCGALTVLDDSLVIMSNESHGMIVQGINEDVGNKAVTEWDGGFDSLYATDNSEVIGTNDSGMFLLWGQTNEVYSGLEMLDGLEMIDTLEMV